MGRTKLGRLAATGPALASALALGLTLWGVQSTAAAAAAAKSKSPEAILASAEKATKAATSFVCKGNGVSDNEKLKIDVAVGAAAAGGTISLNGQAAQLRRLFLLIYVKATQGFFAAEGMSHDQAELVSNHWLEVQSKDTADYSGLGMFLSTSGIVNGLLPSIGSGKVAHSERTELHGQSAYAITGVFDHEKATIYVAAQGTPYVLRVFEPSRSDGGTIDFTEYNKPVHMKVPSNVIGAGTSGGTSA